MVLATAERSPDWLLGPWQVFGISGADGELAGPLFYLGLWLAMISYVVVLAGARAIGPRLAIGSIVAFHVLFLLAPPLLSQDVFSYISYARLEVLHSLNPYTHSPDAVPGDAAFAFAGSKDASSAYGPLFTLATYPLAKVSVPVAFWTLKAIAALASLGIIALAWACAKRLGRDPVFVALAIGLNPLVLVHVVGGAHNDALVVLLLLAAVLAALSVREQLSGFAAALATGFKVSAGLVLPFLVLGARRKAPVIAGAALAALTIIVVSLIAFGGDALDALGLIGENQERTSRWSLPQRSADGIAGLIGGVGELCRRLHASRVRARFCVRSRTAALPNLEGAGRLFLLADGDRMGNARAADRLLMAGPLVRDLAAPARGALREPRPPHLIAGSVVIHACHSRAALTYPATVASEFDLIGEIRKRLGRRGDRVLRTVGDDAAVVRADGVTVTSVDAFVEGVHFRLATTSLRDLGHKCLAASMSDLAAMGAAAGEAYLALGLPPNIGERETLELIDGAEELAIEIGATICGGDVSASNELFVAVTAVGHAPSETEPRRP